MAGEFVYDHPFQWGSKRTGPDLHRVGGKYSDEWHRLHLNNPRDLVPESNMPAYPWLFDDQGRRRDASPPHMTGLRRVGVPVQRRRDRRSAADACAARPRWMRWSAYLQVLGTAVK